MSYEINITGG